MRRRAILNTMACLRYVATILHLCSVS